jgi:hypothetical protein
VSDGRTHGALCANVSDGVSNKAWSLMTFGGQDGTNAKRGVRVSASLGWDLSRELYVALVNTRPVPPVASFWDLANALDGLARARGDLTGKRAAIDCAFYAVGVFDATYLEFVLVVDPCSCSEEADAGACDAGADAAADARPDSHRTPRYTTCMLTHDSAGSPTRTVCQIDEVPPVEGDAGITDYDDGCLYHPNSLNMLVAECPTGSLAGCCTYSHVVNGVPLCAEDCLYLPLNPDVKLGDVKSACPGTWSSDVTSPPACAFAADSGYDAGKDTTSDAGADGGGDAAGPPHC